MTISFIESYWWNSQSTNLPVNSVLEFILVQIIGLNIGRDLPLRIWSFTWITMMSMNVVWMWKIVWIVTQSKTFVMMRCLFFYTFKKRCLFYVHKCLLTRIYGYIPHACLMPKKTRRRYWIPWNYSYRWLVVSYSVGSGNWTWILSKNDKCSWLLSHFSSPAWVL